jgi:hypothetical protein
MKLRLVKMIVQPVLVVDDGENLREVSVKPLPIDGPDWPEFAAGGWKEALADFERDLSAPPDGESG